MIYLNAKPHKEKNEESSEKSGSVQSNEHNIIYFYSDVDDDSILELSKELKAKEIELITQSIKLSIDPPPVYLYINSLGGSLFDGLAGFDLIKMCKIPVYTVVVGCCASAATFLSIAGHNRYITKNSFMLIHQLSSGYWGTYNELVDHMKNLDMFMKKIKELYRDHTNVSMDEIDTILSHDLWWDAENAIKSKLVDGII